MATKAAIAVIRERRAVELAIAGRSYQQIADELGYADPSGAFQAVQRVLRETPAPNVEEARRIQIERLDRMIDSIWATATRELEAIQAEAEEDELEEDNPLQRKARIERLIAREEQHLKAIDQVRKLEERRSKLMGLDAAQQVEATVKHQSTGEIVDSWVTAWEQDKSQKINEGTDGV